MTGEIHKPPLHERGEVAWVVCIGRYITSFPGLLISLLVAKLYWDCRGDIDDPDLWWHFRDAQYLLNSGHFPSVDHYSFTAAGSPWLNHEWLAELCYYGAYRSFGLRGVFLLFTLLLAVMAFMVFHLALKRSGDPYVAAFTTLVGGFLATVGFSPRAQLFGWLCFLGIFAILLRFRENRAAPLWMVPILFMLWVNFHGGWLFGVLIYVMFFICGLVPRDIGSLAAAPWSPRQRKRLVITGAFSIAALMVNPFGYRLLLFPYYIAFRQPLMALRIEEWLPVDFNNPRGRLVASVIAGIVTLAVAGRRRWRIDDAVITAFVLYLGLTHIRFLLLAGITLPAILAPHFGHVGSYDSRRERRGLNTCLLAVAVALCVWGMPSESQLQAHIAATFPADAVGFLQSHPQPGRILNDFDSGGYLEWQLPQVPVFIDPRTDIFQYRGVLADYLSITGISRSQELLDQYGVTYVLFPPNTPLVYFLSNNGRWQRLYEGSNRVIFRRVPNS